MVQLNRDNYESEVKESSIPVLVDFWGPKCVPCLNLMPQVEELEKEYEGKLKFAKLNAAENRMLCARLQVMGLPSFLLYKDGDEAKRIGGQDLTIESIREMIESVV